MMDAKEQELALLRKINETRQALTVLEHQLFQLRERNVSRIEETPEDSRTLLNG